MVDPPMVLSAGLIVPYIIFATRYYIIRDHIIISLQYFQKPGTNFNEFELE